MNEAMKQAWERHRLCGARPSILGEGGIEAVEQQSFAAGYQARDAEVAELQGATKGAIEQLNERDTRIADLEGKVAELREQLRHSARMLPTQKRPDLEFPPEYYEPDDDPLTMPVERLRECVAREVMGWQDNWGQADDWWYRHLTQHSQKGMVRKADFDPLTNPLHTQMVKDRMQERGWQYSVVPFRSMTEPPMNSTILPSPIWHYRVGFANWNGKEVATEASSTEKVNEAICRAALLAVRVKE